MEPMDAGGPIAGRDLRAALARFGPADADTTAFAGLVAADDMFWTFDDLRAACPPEGIGLTPGRFAALFEPLFGEFE